MNTYVIKENKYKFFSVHVMLQKDIHSYTSKWLADFDLYEDARLFVDAKRSKDRKEPLTFE